MVFELFLCVLDGYIYIKSMLVIYFNCMSHYMDFNACFFRGDFSANECSCDISNWFEWKRTGDSREIYVCRCLGKLLQNADWGYFPWYLSCFLCELDGYIYIKSMLVIYFNCMSHYMDFNACFFRGDFSANECSCDISNWFEWKRTGDSREIYVCRCLGKLVQNAD